MAILKKLLILLILSFFTFKKASATEFDNIQIGDVILISLNCYGCQIIESETGSKYSHSSVVINKSGNNVMVAQSLGDVHLLSLKKFLLMKRPGTKAGVFRPKFVTDFSKKEMNRFHERLSNEFYISFLGKKFDSLYLWENFDDNGEELLYCTEMITKLFLKLGFDIVDVKPMDFSKNWDYWYRYYRGEVPQGELGNGPVDFEKGHNFFFLSEVN